MDKFLQIGVGLLATMGVGMIIYQNSISVLSIGNMYYRKTSSFISNLYPLKIIKSLDLKKQQVYLVELLGRSFIVLNTTIDIEAYKKLKKSVKIPHSPDDILETICTTKNGTEIDITEDSRELIGPFLDQFTYENKGWILEYLEKYREINDIKNLTLTFINNTEINI